jgi:hypothetical protein
VTDPFKQPGQFLKGNLHLHTTNSDGELTPQQAVDHYREAGYDFLSITDHGRLTPIGDLETDGMVLLPGEELHQGKGELGQRHHIVAIGMDEHIEVPQTEDLQEALDYIAPRSRFVFLAHPYWTSMTYRDLLGRTGLIGIEVFNFTCECGIGRGDSGVHWDELLVRGEKLLGFAVDDAHLHYPDSLGGWIMLKCRKHTPDAILDAIIEGSFYASSGPTIEDVTCEEEQVTVRCSPCQAVHVICPIAGCGTTTHRLARDGGPYTEVTLPVKDTWNPIRIECVDERGRKAWTNPVWFD